MSPFLTILSMLGLLVGLAARGDISPQMAGAWLAVLVISMGIGRAMGDGLIGTFFRVGIPVLSIVVLVLRLTGTEAAAINLIAQLCSLAMMLFAIYLMTSRMFRW
jgi:hypothetical protein